MGHASNRTIGIGLGAAGVAAGFLAHAGLLSGFAAGITMGAAGTVLGLRAGIAAVRPHPPRR